MEIAAARCRLDNRAADPFGDDDIRRCTANRYQGGLRGRCRQVGAGQRGRIVRLNEPDPRAFGHAALQTRNPKAAVRSEEHTSELQSLMRISYAVFCLKKKKKQKQQTNITNTNKTKLNK